MYPTHQKARPRQEIGGCKEGEFKIQNSKLNRINLTNQNSRNNSKIYLRENGYSTGKT